ncbi:MAG TPA: hypothetical protein VNP98_10695 [Chthoniobacterales bacterium]|nr:hypothetical protein [Chthoniobacterales bacterium]
MTTQFKTLFTVTIAHAYYRQRCEDVAFIIPADTVQLLRNGKLLAKESEGRLTLLFEAAEANQGGSALRPMPGRTVRIGLRLLNPFFSNITKVDQSFASLKLLYGNVGAPAVLDVPTKVQLVGDLFSHALTDDARPVTVTLRDKAGMALQTDEVTAAVDRPAISYDLTGVAPSAYLIDELFPDGLTRNPYYSDAELVQAGVFGLMEVKIDAGFYTTPPDFQIVFEAREETLKYYVVAHNYGETEFNQLTVSDAGAVEDERPPIQFVKRSADAFTEDEISPASLTAGTGRVVLFKSDAVVARTNKARKKIQLRKNDEVLIAHLPQPQPEKTNADLIIPVSKP